jgi:sugar-specific transcriptional regulator TrmB
VESNRSNPNRASEVGEKVGRKLGETVNQIEREAEKVINYINSEVVPAVRQESTSALRTAAQKLAEFADYLDDQKRKQQGP